MNRLTRSVRSVAVAVVVMAALGACGGSGGDGSGSTGWPDVPVSSVSDGSTVSSADVVAEGVSVVSLWATWCGPCKRELPMLQQMADEGTRVVGVNIGDSPDAVAAFLDDLGVSFPNYIDVDGEVLSGLDVPSVPATLVVADGELVWQNLGEVDRAAIESALSGY